MKILPNIGVCLAALLLVVCFRSWQGRLPSISMLRGTTDEPSLSMSQNLIDEMADASSRYRLVDQTGNDFVLFERFTYGNQKLFAVLGRNSFRVYTKQSLSEQGWKLAKPLDQEPVSESLILSPSLGFIKLADTKQGSGSVRVTVTNESSSTFRLESIVPSCSCLKTSQFDSSPILVPGAEISFQATLDGGEFNESVSQKLLLSFRNIGDQSEERIEVPVLFWQPLGAYVFPPEVLLPSKVSGAISRANVRIQETALEKVTIRSVHAETLPVLTNHKQIRVPYGEAFHSITIELEDDSLAPGDYSDVIVVLHFRGKVCTMLSGVSL